MRTTIEITVNICVFSVSNSYLRYLKCEATQSEVIDKFRMG